MDLVDNGTGMYQELAPYYRQYSEGRAAFLGKVDGIIIRRLSEIGEVKRLLDAGSGDGYRAQKISRMANIAEVTLCEKVGSMASLCRQREIDRVWECDILDIPAEEGYFDVVTCLWNVLGAIPTPQRKTETLTKLYHSIKERGVLFVDVANRYNASHYGWFLVLKPFLSNLFRSRSTKNDILFNFSIDHQTIPGYGHVFSPKEIETLLTNSGFKIRNRLMLNYETGEETDSIFRGHLFYEAVK